MLKHDKDVVLDVLKSYLDLCSETATEQFMDNQSCMWPKEVGKKFKENFEELNAYGLKIRDELMLEYQEGKIEFKEMVIALNKAGMNLTSKAHVDFLRISLDYEDEINEFQLENIDEIKEKLKEAGINFDVK